MALTVVGFTGSLESSTARGPNDGFAALNRSCAHAVIGGSSPVNAYDRYRVAADELSDQTPAKSGGVRGAAAVCVCARPAAETTATAAVNASVADSKRFDMMMSCPPRVSGSSPS